MEATPRSPRRPRASLVGRPPVLLALLVVLGLGATLPRSRAAGPQDPAEGSDPPAEPAAAIAPGQGPLRALDEVYAVGDESLWVFEQRGEEIGRAWSRYEGPRTLGLQRLHAFTGCVRLELPVNGERLVQEHTADLWTDAHGHPERVDYRLAMRDLRAGVELVRADGGLAAQLWQGPTVTERNLDLPAHAYVLANNFLGHLELALVTAPPDPERPRTYDLLSINVLSPIPWTVTPEAPEPAAEDPAGGEPVGGDPASAPVPPRVFRDTLGQTLHLDPDGRLLRVEVPAQGLVLRRVDEPFEPFRVERPARRTRPDDLHFEEVRIESDGVSLAGELSRPKGVEGPLPTVFFVSGSGGQDRDGLAGGIDVGTGELLDHLTRAGYQVLRVDDRGVGGSTGPVAELTFDDLVADARRCVDWLRARPDVDPARLALIGHSEGGLTAPLLAVEGGDPPLAAIVLMAAPARPVDALVREQVLAGARREGADGARLEALGAAVDAFFAHLREADEVPADLPPELEVFRDAGPWLRSHLDRDPLEVVARVPCPVLVLQGERDIQVSAERDARPLEAALAAADHPDHALHVFPELDHLFKRTEPGSAGLDYLEQRPVDPGFLGVLTAWLDARLRP